MDKLVKKLKSLIIIYPEKLYHAQKLQKQANNKVIKLKSYILNNKI